MKFRYTLPALAYLNSVLDCIVAHSPQGARRVEAAFRRPSIFCCITPPSALAWTIRRMAALPYPYLIFYEAKEAKIIIHAIRHSIRDPSGMPGARA